MTAMRLNGPILQVRANSTPLQFCTVQPNRIDSNQKRVIWPLVLWAMRSAHYGRNQNCWGEGGGVLPSNCIKQSLILFAEVRNKVKWWIAQWVHGISAHRNYSKTVLVLLK